MLELILLVILNFLCPPVAVAIKCGLGEEFVICLVLTLLAWIPGVLYGLYILLRN